jgi:hypothetical protein
MHAGGIDRQNPNSSRCPSSTLWCCSGYPLRLALTNFGPSGPRRYRGQRRLAILLVRPSPPPCLPAAPSSCTGADPLSSLCLHNAFDPDIASAETIAQRRQDRDLVQPSVDAVVLTDQSLLGACPKLLDPVCRLSGSVLCRAGRFGERAASAMERHQGTIGMDAMPRGAQRR